MEWQEKLEKWLRDKYGSMSNASVALNIPQPSLSRMITKASYNTKPGFDLLKKMRQEGLDLNWLFSDSDVPTVVMEAPAKYNTIKNEINSIKQQLKSIEEKLDE